MARKNPPGSIQAPPGSETLTDREIQVLDDIRQKIPLALENYSKIARIDDYKKCKSLEWHGFCIYVGKILFSDPMILRENPEKENIYAAAFNLRLLSAVYDLYEELCCTVPGLPCRAFDFQAFVNINHAALGHIRERVTSLGGDLLQKIAHSQENSVAFAGEAGRINPTMALAWNNHFHGWTQSREIIHRDGGQIMDSGSWSGRFLGDNPKPCSIPEGKENQGETVLLPETTQ